jgi:hypothetical protein
MQADAYASFALCLPREVDRVFRKDILQTPMSSHPPLRQGAPQRLRLHRHTVMKLKLLQTPWLSTLHFLHCGDCGGKVVESWCAGPLLVTRSYSVLANRSFYSGRLAFFSTYRDPFLRHISRNTSLMVEIGMAQPQRCLDPRPGLALGGRLNGLCGSC